MDIRKSFLDYFASKGHTVVDSSPLVPDDASLLFTNAGMVQFKSIFTGEVPAPNPPRAASSQTCIRAGGKHNDLENVGFTARHHTFFEMLGNFSFGDYFKEDAIKYAWEFITEEMSLPKDKLWISIHESDDEAGKIWEKYVPKERIVKMGDKDNFWQMGDTGPCGPCSEIHFDQGAEHFNSPEDYFGGEGDRFLEIWNLVFMQYERFEDGSMTPLPKPSIDTGMGLERITAIKEGKFSNYDSSLFMPLIDAIEAKVGKKYEYASGASYRVIADHLRAVSFLVAQGVTFDKEGRGYVLRRILRRAVRHGYKLGLKEPFLYALYDALVSLMGCGYPYLAEKAEYVKESIKAEEERFFSTLFAGMELFEKEMSQSPKIFSGETAFKLYDTFGFPLDLTEDMLRERGVALDSDGFDAKMKEQRERAKAAWKGSGDVANEGDFKELLEKFGKNEFIGYEKLEADAKVLALLDADFKAASELTGEGWVMLDNTPFYAASGGQAGDTGELAGKATVLDTRKFFELNLSKINATSKISVGDTVKAVVSNARSETAKHHSATHLLHAVLREVLGNTVTQAGSDVDDKRLRFDFTAPKAMTAEQIAEVEAKVNALIARNISGKTEIMGIEEAKNSGAMALFGEKYGDKVRVVSFGDASVELCGGTHTCSTGEIGSFYIVKESGVSAGVRRIEAVVGLAAIEYAKSFRATVNELEGELKNKDLKAGVARLRAEIKELKEKLAKAQSSGKKELEALDIGGAKVVCDFVDGVDAKALVDELKNKYEKAAVMLLEVGEDKISAVCGTKGVDLNAGEWLRSALAAADGKGGGRADFASGSAKDVSKKDELKAAALEFIRSKLGG
jgi:alanyl-tRNA synthetase